VRIKISRVLQRRRFTALNSLFCGNGKAGTPRGDAGPLLLTPGG
jgi:hypothetical protein